MTPAEQSNEIKRLAHQASYLVWGMCAGCGVIKDCRKRPVVSDTGVYTGLVCDRCFDSADDQPNPEADVFRCAHCGQDGLIEQAATVQAYAGPEYVHADCELDWRVTYIERSTPLSWGDVSRDITWLIAQVRQLQSQLKVLEDYVEA